MAVALEQKNLLNYLQAFQERVKRRTNINLFDKDSKTQALIDIFSDQLLTDRKDTVTAFNAIQLSQASGDNLDKISPIKRLEETFATVSSNELSLAFYVTEGTFGDINGGGSFVVPKGTTVTSDANQNDLGTKITYQLIEDVTCFAGSALVYCSARSVASGPASNVGANTLRNHSFTSYTAKTGLQVINFYSILNGRRREADDQYRFRSSQYYATIATNNSLKAQLIALSIPGVLNTKVIAGHYGIGTIGLVVLGTEFQSSTALVSTVQAALTAAALPGVKVSAIPAVNALVDIEVTLRTTRTLSSSEQTRVKNLLRKVSVNYLRSQGLGGTVSLSDLAKLWSKATGGLVLFQTGATEIFDHVYIRRGYVTSIASERETMSSNFYSLQLDEFADLGQLTLSFE